MSNQLSPLATTSDIVRLFGIVPPAAYKLRDLYEADRSKLMAVLQVCADAIENSRVELCSAIPHLPTVGVNLATAREKECRDALSQLKAIGVEPNK